MACRDGQRYVPVMRERTPETGEPLEPLDPMVEAYMEGIDLTLLRENLKLTPTQRVEKLMALQRLAAEARRSAAGRG
mgnify:CR=1 FL=1|jgi:hypothetical protein